MKKLDKHTPVLLTLLISGIRLPPATPARTNHRVLPQDGNSTTFQPNHTV
jgi:hypothetical protein